MHYRATRCAFCNGLHEYSWHMLLAISRDQLEPDSAHLRIVPVRRVPELSHDLGELAVCPRSIDDCGSGLARLHACCS